MSQEQRGTRVPIYQPQVCEERGRAAGIGECVCGVVEGSAGDFHEGRIGDGRPEIAHAVAFEIEDGLVKVAVFFLDFLKGLDETWRPSICRMRGRRFEDRGKMGMPSLSQNDEGQTERNRCVRIHRL